jgi:hypothetical protein
MSYVALAAACVFGSMDQVRCCCGLCCVTAAYSWTAHSPALICCMACTAPWLFGSMHQVLLLRV